MNDVVPAIFSAVRLADGRWMLVGPIRNGRTDRFGEASSRRGWVLSLTGVVVKVEVGASRRLSDALAS